MYKQSNVSSELLDKMVKAAENAKPRDYQKDFIDQIIPILTTKPQTLQDVFSGIVKTAQIDLPDENLDAGTEPMSDMPDETPDMDALPDETMDEPIGEPEEALDAVGSLADQLKDIADQLQRVSDQVSQLEGGDDLEGDMDIADDMPVDEPTDMDMDVPDETPLPDEGVMPEPKPLAAPASAPTSPAPMYAAMTNHVKKTASVQANGKRKN